MHLLFRAWPRAAARPPQATAQTPAALKITKGPVVGERVVDLAAIRRNGKRIASGHVITHHSVPREPRRPHWSAAKLQTRLRALRRAS